jgi:hypothetical protein
MKTCDGVEVSFLTSALDGGEWLASLPCRFTPGKKVSGAHWIGDWMAPRRGLDAVEKRKLAFPSRESNPGRPVRNPTLHLLSYLGSSGRCHALHEICSSSLSFMNTVTPANRRFDLWILPHVRIPKDCHFPVNQRPPMRASIWQC